MLQTNYNKRIPVISVVINIAQARDGHADIRTDGHAAGAEHRAAL